jgi:hypothetical protein
MEEPNESHHEINDHEDCISEDKVTTNGRPPSRTCSDDDTIVGEKHTEQSCIYKALTSPKLRKRKQPISMFDVQPSATEIVQVQEICIETGAEQRVKESLVVLPDITSGGQISDENKLTTESYDTRSLPITSDRQPEVYDR